VAFPWQNGFVEPFYGRVKHELGNVNHFTSAARCSRPSASTSITTIMIAFTQPSTCHPLPLWPILSQTLVFTNRVLDTY
jgi:hypothetical protein